MNRMKIKALTFFLGLSFCFVSCSKIKTAAKDFNLFFFFKKPLTCESSLKNFSKTKRESLLKKAELCFKEAQAEKAVFILERTLKRDKIMGRRPEEIKNLTKQLAERSFYLLKNYEKALKHYSALLKFPLPPSENFSARHHIAKSYFYLKKHSQALIEIEPIFVEALSMEERKKALILKGEIFMAQNHFDKALQLFQDQIENYPDQRDFFRENRAFIYESQKNFSLAVQELEKIEKPSLFISRKIERLKERQSNQPGFP